MRALQLPDWTSERSSMGTAVQDSGLQAERVPELSVACTLKQ